jgi:hypothetical protein
MPLTPSSIRRGRRFEFRIKLDAPIDAGRFVSIHAMLSDGTVEVQWSTEYGTTRTWVHKSRIECVEIIEDPPESGIFKEREHANKT